MIGLLDSGGKESRLSYELLKYQGISHRITLVEESRILTHRTDILQDRFLIDVTGKVHKEDNYAEMWTWVRTVLAGLRLKKVITGIAFSDEAARVQAEKLMLGDTGIQLEAPLLGWSHKRILEEVISRGIKARIISVSEGVNTNLVGRIITTAMVPELSLLNVCGGYLGHNSYHTEVED